MAPRANTVPLNSANTSNYPTHSIGTSTSNINTGTQPVSPARDFFLAPQQPNQTTRATNHPSPPSSSGFSPQIQVIGTTISNFSPSSTQNHNVSATQTQSYASLQGIPFGGNMLLNFAFQRTPVRPPRTNNFAARTNQYPWSAIEYGQGTNGSVNPGRGMSTGSTDDDIDHDDEEEIDFTATTAPSHTAMRGIRRSYEDASLGIATTQGGASSSSHFRYKVVCQLNCRHCQRTLCWRGMKAILLADTKVELYSTDTPPQGVQLVNDDYTTDNCRCRINDVACLGCGNVVGYHVTQPCETCLESCNNGHFWMFQTDGVLPIERRVGGADGGKVLLWAQLPPADKDMVGFGIGPNGSAICR